MWKADIDAAVAAGGVSVIAASSSTTSRPMLNRDRMPTALRVLHVICACIHLASAIATPLYMGDVSQLPFYQIVYLGGGLAQTSVEAGRVSAYTFVLSFFLVSFVEHVFCAAATYEYIGLAANVAWHRWISYGISAPLMIVTAAYASGVADACALIAIAGLVFGSIAMGPLHDIARRDGRGTGPGLTVACVLLLFAFAPIWTSYTAYADAPGFVTAIVVLVAMLFFSFEIVPLVSVMRKEPAPYYKSEYAYCILSLISKLLLGYLFGGGYVAMYASN